MNARTCKHLKGALGEAYEKARLENAEPSPDVGLEQIVCATVLVLRDTRQLTAAAEWNQAQSAAGGWRDARGVLGKLR